MVKIVCAFFDLNKKKSTYFSNRVIGVKNDFGFVPKSSMLFASVINFLNVFFLNVRPHHIVKRLIHELKQVGVRLLEFGWC